MTDRFLPPDDDARALARRLMVEARHGALATLRDGEPFVTRIALAPDPEGFLTLVSDLAPHTEALRTHPVASLLVGEPGRGDPLAHARMTLSVRATFLDKTEDAARTYLAAQPKAQLYIGFADFHLVRLDPRDALLNGGFGKAHRLDRADLAA